MQRGGDLSPKHGDGANVKGRDRPEREGSIRCLLAGWWIGYQILRWPIRCMAPPPTIADTALDVSMFGFLPSCRRELRQHQTVDV